MDRITEIKNLLKYLPDMLADYKKDLKEVGFTEDKAQLMVEDLQRQIKI